ncbi:hypothetical protein MKW94_005957 [Papaver nudicaule]|uniref:CrcB-like protein n=1 Tax=Papaver nudicaule TaxID=74823 RepID=A0AA41VCB7_PAPNU|nr:hypothetical protein [Papaver nudicaule]
MTQGDNSNGLVQNSGDPTNLENANGSSRTSLGKENYSDRGSNASEVRRSGSYIIRSMSSSSRRNSLSISRGGSVQLLDDKYEEEIASQAGDIGDRVIQSKRHSENGSCRLFSVDNLVFLESGLAPPPEEPYLQNNRCWLQNSNDINGKSPISEIVSPLPTDGFLHARDGSQSGSFQKSSQHFQETPYNLPVWLEYVLYLVHLAVFGILGMLTRYLLQKLFGPTVASVTSDETALYLDLPSNMLGSFLMGWFGVVFKPDISHFSDFVAVGLSTGYLGSLTTFSGWNQKMLDLAVRGKWVVAAVECLIGIFVLMSIILGIQTAKEFRCMIKRRGNKNNSPNERPCVSCNWRIDNINRHMAVLILLLVVLCLLWSVSGVLLSKWVVDDGKPHDSYLWLACVVAPPGVWIRWLLARLNGRGLGREGLMKWVPFGTLIANVSAASIMAALATVKEVVNSESWQMITTGIQFGFLGCLSTVSTFAAEYYALSQTKHSWRAHVYAAITILPSFGLGTLIYSLPMWAKGHK